MTNLGEAAWLSPTETNEKGGVFVTIVGPDSLQAPIPTNVPHLRSLTMDDIPLLPEMPTRPVKLILSFEARGRTPFGEKLVVELVPRPAVR